VTKPHRRPASVGYQLFTLILCLYALAALALETAVRLEPGTRAILDYADYAVCTLFFLDFIISMWRAPDRWRYFITWGWLDLLSSVPTVDVVRWGRAARIVRVFRVLRGLRATKLVAGLVLQRRAENTILAASLVALLLIVFCSVAILHFEVTPESNIKTAEDAVWWAFATITTVGYGDRYPVTSEGRFVAAILMTGGVGLFGTFSGFLAAWFIESGAAEGTDVSADISSLRTEIAALRKLLDHVGQDVAEQRSSDPPPGDK
jgi:voltage-gated potassium channel